MDPTSDENRHTATRTSTWLHELTCFLRVLDRPSRTTAALLSASQFHAVIMANKRSKTLSGPERASRTGQTWGQKKLPTIEASKTSKASKESEVSTDVVGGGHELCQRPMHCRDVYLKVSLMRNARAAIVSSSTSSLTLRHPVGPPPNFVIDQHPPWWL